MLIECPECHKQISSDATSCPNCGKPMKEVKSSSQEFFDTLREQPEVKEMQKAQGCQKKVVKAILILFIISLILTFAWLIFGIISTL